MVQKIYLPLQMTEKIAVEVGAKNRFEKKCKNRQKSFFSNAFLTPSKKVGPNLKPDSDRFLYEVSITGLKKLSTMTND